MSRLDALRALHDAVKDGMATSDHFGAVWPPRASNTCLLNIWGARAYNDDLNAARALHDAVRPGWAVNRISENRSFNRWTVEIGHKAKYCIGRSDKPARAWLLAVIASLIEEEGE
jgi:hypothetical protein